MRYRLRTTSGLNLKPTLHENSDDDMHINEAWETITQNIRISAKERSLSRSNGTSQTVVATGSKKNKWR
jgi:hypothetical protein